MVNNAAPDHPHIAGGKVAEDGTLMNKAVLHYSYEVSILACHPPKEAEEFEDRSHTSLE